MKISFRDFDGIRELLVGRTVIEVNSDEQTLTLDNGVQVSVDANSGCWMCPSGNYDVDSINTVENVITNVKVKTKTDDDNNTVYSIVVYSAGVPNKNKKKKDTLLTVSGTDGNGWYGTGFELEIIDVN